IRYGVSADAGRTVAGEGVVPFRMIFQRVHLWQVIQKNLPDKILRRIDMIQIDLFTPVIRPKPDQVAFVGNHISQLVLPEKPLYGRVVFTDFLTGFDGEADNT